MKKISMILTICALVLAGCGTNNTKEDDAHDHEAHGGGDIHETTAGVDVLPNFLDGAPELLSAAYKVVGKNADVLEYIPCYCGCGESVDHKSNRDCFINEIKENGEIVWDSHATTCQNCIEIGIVASKMNSEGKSWSEIREHIDKTYSEGYAEPTPTPLPPS